MEPMSVAARLQVSSIEPRASYGGPATDEDSSAAIVKLVAVYDPNPESPNYTFSKYTPSANLEMYVTNPAAIEQFEVGQVFDVTFTPTDPASVTAGHQGSVPGVSKAFKSPEA